MKYRSALTIHFKPGKSRVAIPLLRDLWNGATIMRRVGKETALIGMYKDFETLEEMKSSFQSDTKIADQLDPMIIEGSVTQHIWQHKFNEVHHSNVRRVYRTKFHNMFAYEEVEDAIKENMDIAQQNGRKITHWRKLFDSPDVFILSQDFESLDECAEDVLLPEMRKNRMLIMSRISDVQEGVWMKVD